MSGESRVSADLLIVGASEVACPDPGRPGAVRRIENGAVAAAEGTIVSVGTESELQASTDLGSAQRIDAGGGLVLPGFVDCHTHLVFGGSRAREYAARLTKSSADVEAMGIPTGIAASVRMTRAATDDELEQGARRRLDAMLAQGTTTAESKTGYGLTTEEELRLLALNRRLDSTHDVDVISTFMGAHAFPDGDRTAYLETLVEEMIPAAAESGNAEFNDVFCDEGYFTVDEAERILRAGVEAGLAPKIHTDQYSRLGGSVLAARLGVVSADHLNFAEDEDLAALAAAGVTGVLMPLIDFAVGHPRPVRARRWVESGLAFGLATDLCPGGWSVSMPLAMQFACRWNGLSPEESLWAATVGGARALNRRDRGALEPGFRADIVVIDVPSLDDLVYRLGHAPVRAVLKGGRLPAA